MKNLIVAVLLLNGLFSSSQQLTQLSFDEDKYFYFRTPNAQRNLNYTVDIKVPSVELISSDNGIATQKFRSRGVGNFGTGKPVKIIAMPLLFQVEKRGQTTVYKFGENAGEDNMNSAEVRVTSRNLAASPQKSLTRRFSFFVNIPSEEIFTKTNSSNWNKQPYLRIEASAQESMTIEIDRESRRGNVFVCIFNAKGEIVATLNPKDLNDNSSVQSFTVEEPVYIIPVIGSKFTRQNETDVLTFEVGDPKEVATVEIIEE